MSASEYIKSKGLPSLAYVADAVGKHRDTINNWYHKEFALFEVVVAGVVAREGCKHVWGTKAIERGSIGGAEEAVCIKCGVGPFITVMGNTNTGDPISYDEIQWRISEIDERER